MIVCGKTRSSERLNQIGEQEEKDKELEQKNRRNKWKRAHRERECEK